MPPQHCEVVPQLAPLAVFPCEGTPLVQRSVVQGLLSFGLSLLLITVVHVPAPLQEHEWQSPLTAPEQVLQAVEAEDRWQK